jgi:hypothetical protein
VRTGTKVGIGVGIAAAVGAAWWLLRERTIMLGELDMVDMAPAFTAGVRPRRSPPRFIVIHHSATSSPSKTRAALKAHGTATHFEVDQAGRIYRYLDPQTAVAEHAGWINADSIGIDVTHVTNAPWPPAQVAAVARLVAALCAEFAIPRLVAPDGQLYPSGGLVPPGVGILRHRNVRTGGTLCPQDFPMAALGPVLGAAVA